MLRSSRGQLALIGLMVVVAIVGTAVVTVSTQMSLGGSQSGEPALIGTPFPATVARITTENADGVISLSRWGDAIVLRVAYASGPAGPRVALVTHLGVSVYDANGKGDFTSGFFIPTDSPANVVALSADGTMLALAQENEIVIWKITGKFAERRRKLDSHKEPVLSLTFTPDGSSLISSGKDDNLFRWSLPSGRKKFSFDNMGPFGTLPSRPIISCWLLSLMMGLCSL
jgi:WD40 repeat protein